jgi:hypothetical protein
MSDQQTSAAVILDYPLRRGEGHIETVSLRRPLSGELRGLSLTGVLQMDVDALTKLLPRITIPPLTEADVRSLDPSDLVQLGTATAGFFVARRFLAETQD